MFLRPILICNINCTNLSKNKCTYKRILTLLSLEWFHCIVVCTGTLQFEARTQI